MYSFIVNRNNCTIMFQTDVKWTGKILKFVLKTIISVYFYTEDSYWRLKKIWKFNQKSFFDSFFSLSFDPAISTPSTRWQCDRWRLSRGCSVCSLALNWWCVEKTAVTSALALCSDVIGSQWKELSFSAFTSLNIS